MIGPAKDSTPAPSASGDADARLRSIIDSALDAIVATNAKSIIIEWNRRAEEIFGWTASEALGMTLADTIIPPGHHEAHRRGVERYVATGEKRIIGTRVVIEARHRDGRLFPVELTVAAAGAGPTLIFNSFIRDLTEPDRAERRRDAEHGVTRVLAESHSLQEAAVPLLAVMGEKLGWDVGGLWSVDTHTETLRCEGIWQRAGVAADRFAATSRTATFERGAGLPGRIWASGEPAWIANVAREGNFSRKGPAADGGLCSAFAFPLIADGKVLGVVEFFSRASVAPDEPLLETVRSIGVNIGHAIGRVRAEQQRDVLIADLERINDHLQLANATLAQRTREAEEARAMADAASRAKSDFLANMSHELRTPINGIVGYAELLEMEIAGPVTEKQRAHIQRIQASSRHLLTLINDILDLAKVEAGQLSVDEGGGSTSQAVEAALQIVGPKATEQGISLESKCEGGRYLGDERRVRQILVNLLSNAVKFTERGGSVTLRCGPTDRVDPAARVDGAGPWAFFQVEDTGIGIAPEDMDVIFEAFVQAETGRTRTFGGTGLGLTISRRLARLMGGDITARSTRGKGSTFTLWLRAPGAEGR